MPITPLSGSDTFKTWFDATNTIISTVNGLNVVGVSGATGINITISGNTAIISNTGIIGVCGGTGISVSVNNGIASLQNVGVFMINGQTGNVTITGLSGDIVTSFNGRTGGVTGVVDIVVGTGLSKTGSLSTPTLTNTGVLLFNGNAGSVFGVDSFNGLTGAVSGVTTSVTNTFTPLQAFAGGITTSGITVTGQIITSGLGVFDGGISASGATFSRNINLASGDFIRNSTSRRIDFMPGTTSASHFGLFIDQSTWGFGPIIRAIRASDQNTTVGSVRFDSDVALNSKRLNLNSGGQQYFQCTTAPNLPTTQFVVNLNTGVNSGALALVDVSGSDSANRSPGVTHTNPNLYIYAAGATNANDFIRIEHNRINANIITGQTSGILMQPGSGWLGISGGISAAGATFSSYLSAPGLVKTVNGNTPDGNGNVSISVGGGGGGGAGITWTVINTNRFLEVNNGVFTNPSSGILGLTLPTSSNVGAIIRISGITGGWKVGQGAGQAIYFGNINTTLGTGGYIQSTHPRDSVELICYEQNALWNITSSIGNIGVV